MIQYAICWDLIDGDNIFKSLFQKFELLGSKTIYKNLYDYHVLEKPAMTEIESKKLFTEISNINQIYWIIYSYKIPKNNHPRVSINLFLSPLSLIKLIIRGYFRLPFYSLTIASHDTRAELIDSYTKIISSFLKEFRFKKIKSLQASLIEYESGKWERRIG